MKPFNNKQLNIKYQMAVGQRNAVVNVLPVFIFHVLVRKLVLYEHQLKLVLSGQRAVECGWVAATAVRTFL